MLFAIVEGARAGARAEWGRQRAGRRGVGHLTLPHGGCPRLARQLQHEATRGHLTGVACVDPETNHQTNH